MRKWLFLLMVLVTLVSCGGRGSTLQEPGISFQYYDRWFEAPDMVISPGGHVRKESSVVPPGEVWVLQAAMALDNTTLLPHLAIGVGDGPTRVRIFDKQQDHLDIAVTWTGEVILKEGDRAHVWFYGSSPGDNLWWRFWGYKMRLP